MQQNQKFKSWGGDLSSESDAQYRDSDSPQGLSHDFVDCFNPGDRALLVEAYDSAMAAIRRNPNAFRANGRMREAGVVVAESIIEAAKKGDLDPRRLCARALLKWGTMNFT